MSAHLRYRKRPVEVDAWQFDGTQESGEAICAWANENGAQAEYHPFLADHFKGDPKVYIAHPDPYLRIVTLEGTTVASKGDWIIRGVKGEFYLRKPDIFEATYESLPPKGLSDGYPFGKLDPSNVIDRAIVAAWNKGADDACS